tara:strand:- start:395 stop:2209 length:1815 start_codon:yes stop_codon:yes gene_type:complete
MSELHEILEEEYLKQINEFDLKMLLEMVEEVLDAPMQLEEGPPVAGTPPSEEKELEMLLKMIPDIAVSEIGWSDVRNVAEGQENEIKGPERQLLEGYLKNIGKKGANFAEKIESISNFYTNGAGMVAEMGGADRTKRIVQAISYLVFYKTLTKVITNFNASSAGFSFESFLAALVNGYQIPTNTGTIADYVDRSTGEVIPVSLKLYRQGALEVGGSYKDLVNDLTGVGKETDKWPGFANKMRYVVCTKEIDDKAAGLDQEGKINFYQFDFTLNNIMEILHKSSDKSRLCIRLPRELLSAVKGGVTKGAENYMNDRLPSRSNLPSAEELEKIFTDGLKQILINKKIAISQMQFDDLTQALDYGKDDKIFLPADPEIYGGGAQVGVVRGQSDLNAKVVEDILKKFDWYEAPLRTTTGRKATAALLQAIVSKKAGANGAVKKTVSSRNQADKRKAELSRLSQGEEHFLSPEESAKEYGQLGTEQQKIALLNSLGYLRTYKFHLSHGATLSIQTKDTKTEFLGAIVVGRRMVGEVLKSVRELLNTEIYEIFQSLKILSDSLNLYFAGGLENNTLAKAATTNANNIGSKEILQSDDESGTQLPLPFSKQ